jgi:hypothetical protein
VDGGGSSSGGCGGGERVDHRGLRLLLPIIVVMVMAVEEVNIVTFPALITDDSVFVVCCGRCRAVGYVRW